MKRSDLPPMTGDETADGAVEAVVAILSIAAMLCIALGMFAGFLIWG